MITLTDQELNEWVALNILKPDLSKEKVYVVPIPSNNNSRVTIGPKGCQLNPCSFCKRYDFCNDLNHTHLMEEKIMEMGKIGKYLTALYAICDGYIECYLDTWQLVNATARQKVEAAYLCFNKEKNE